MGYVILSEWPVSASGSAGWKFPLQKGVLAAAMTRCLDHLNLLLFHSGAEPQLFWCLARFPLWEWAHTLRGNSSQLVLHVVVFFPLHPINSHDHKGTETDQLIESFDFQLIIYFHDRASNLCRISINLSFNSCSPLLSFANKHQRYVYSSTWGSNSSLEWRAFHPVPDWEMLVFVSCFTLFSIHLNRIWWSLEPSEAKVAKDLRPSALSLQSFCQ